jgi:hypothetical protein
VTGEIFNKFSKTVEYIYYAIIEKIEGRVPNKKEINEHLKIEHLEGHYNVFWHNHEIMRAWLEEPEEGVIHGEFEIPTQYNDEYIIDRTKNWI